MRNAVLHGCGAHGTQISVPGDTADPYRHTSKQVSWWSVYEFVRPLLDGVAAWPSAGTPAWARLDDTDPRKVAAVIAAGLHWSLRIDCLQAEVAEASKAVAGSADWSSVAEEHRRIEDFYAAKPWLKRRAS
jgi:hypothetical protein